MVPQVAKLILTEPAEEIIRFKVASQKYCDLIDTRGNQVEEGRVKLTMPDPFTIEIVFGASCLGTPAWGYVKIILTQLGGFPQRSDHMMTLMLAGVNGDPFPTTLLVKSHTSQYRYSVTHLVLRAHDRTDLPGLLLDNTIFYLIQKVCAVTVQDLPVMRDLVKAQVLHLREAVPVGSDKHDTLTLLGCAIAGPCAKKCTEATLLELLNLFRESPDMKRLKRELGEVH